VVNYGDYQCPGCQQRHRSTEKMARELLDSVRLVHRVNAPGLEYFLPWVSAESWLQS